MEHMFTETPFNQPLNNWNVSDVTIMKYMFADTRFNQPLNKWNVSNGLSMEGMFHEARSFNRLPSQPRVDQQTPGRGL